MILNCYAYIKTELFGIVFLSIPNLQVLYCAITSQQRFYNDYHPECNQNHIKYLALYTSYMYINIIISSILAKWTVFNVPLSQIKNMAGSQNEIL